jgi:dipeptidyl aminopeptidase/acylaminoacyl peptidase
MILPLRVRRMLALGTPLSTSMCNVRRGLVVLGALLAPATRPAHGQAPPATDVFLVPLTGGTGRLTAGAVRNITARDGYDNQPSWSPDGRLIYFTSVRDDAQADIYGFDVASGTTTRVTTTAPESEYSATVTPDGRAISVIRVERDSTQRLWRVPLDGSASSVVLAGVKPVGYHAWVDSVTLALFVLGSPNTLQVADTRTGRADTVATSIGRSLHRVPGQRRVSFVHKVSRTEWWLVLLDPASRAMERLVRMPAGVEDYAWTPDGRVVIGEKSVLRSFDPRGSGGWETVADLASGGVAEITRLAVSPRGEAIAIVGVPAK